MAWWGRLWPFKKEIAKAEKRVYQGAIVNRLTSDWVTSGTSADSEILTSLRPLRNRSRSLCRDNDYAKGAVRTITNNLIGKGITLQAKVKQRRGGKLDERVNTAIEELWKEWGKAKYCNTAGKHSFKDIQRIAARSLIESGEVFIRLVRQPFAGSPVPLALELIESDQLADDRISAIAPTGNEIRMGVEIDRWGRPVAYHFYERHPGDYQFSRAAVGQNIIRVPADEVIHLFLADRPGQTRGVPWFHSALLTFRHLAGYTEAEIVAARAQASVMGVVETPEPDSFTVEKDESGQRVNSLEPGAIEYLLPGEKFNGFAPTRPNQGFEAFVAMCLRGVAAGIGLSYEALSRDFTNTSYSSARTSLMDERDNYRVVQDWIIEHLLDPVYEEWLDLAVLGGAIALPNYETNRSNYQAHKFTARGWQWVDPQNEVAANKEAVKAGFTSIGEVVSQQGLDIEEVLAEQKRIVDLADELAIGLDVIIPKSEEAPDFKSGVSLTAGGGEAAGDGTGQAPMEGMTPVGRSFSRAKNCKKGIACGNTCIAANKVCKATLTPAAKAKKPPAAKATKKAKTTTAAPATPAPAPTPPTPGRDAIKTNAAELDSKRANLTKRFGKKLVEDAEKNVKRILEDPDNDIYVRVGSADTLEKILGNRFQTSAELGITQHKIPYLSDDYQTARNRVEAKVMGYDANTAPGDRPIYGYLGGKNLDGNSHSDLGDYGSIVVKLKPETKERSTFTGADSFKSGIASELVSDGDPPPPNAASLVASTRHGYDKDKLPPGYPAFYKSKAGDKLQLTRASTAKDLDDLVNHLSPTGARYVETQIHGGVRPSDIAELRFESNKAKPTPAIGKLARDNKIDLYIDGKKLDSKQIDSLIAGNTNPLAKTGYKPFMTRAEADEYTKDSVWKDKVFYHGTNSAAAKNITTNGVDPFRTTVSFYGKGFYTTTEKGTADNYAKSSWTFGTKPQRIGVKLDVRNPFVVSDHKDLCKKMKKLGVTMQPNANQPDPTARKIRATLLKNGYDAIEVRSLNYFIPLDGERVAAFEIKDVR